MRRMEAAQAASPIDVPKFASDSWRNATFRKADEKEFLNKYGHLLSGEDQIARFDRLMLEGKRARSRAISWPSCRPTTSRSPMRGWRWRRKQPMR